jgi:phosphoglycerol transferase
VAYFTASVVGESPYELLNRLHMRYYNFLFPLFLIVVAGQLTTKNMRRNRYVVLFSAAVLIALIVFSFRLLLRLYAPSLIDSPELHGVTMTTASFYVVGILGIVSLIVWAFSQRRGAQLVLFLVMPVTILLGAVNGNTELRRYHLTASAEDNAGIFARAELDPLERSRVVVVGSEPAGLYHALFYIDDPRATVTVIPKGAAFDPKAIPPGYDWVLLMGDHALPDDIDDKIVSDGYILFQLPSKANDERPGYIRKTVHFSHPFRFGLVESISGASVPELFGRWSEGKEVQIKMSSALPRRFDLRLMARAFGPNAQLPFTMQIGGETQTFRLSSDITVVTLPFTTDGKTRTITIEVPQPTSPRQLGQGNDERLLGIALMQMSIETEAESTSAR